MLTAMDAILATIVDGGRAIIVIFREAGQISVFSCNLLILLKPFNGGHGTNVRKALHPSGGVGSSNPRRRRGQRLHHGGGLCWM
jgi:hypothetical protein